MRKRLIISSSNDILQSSSPWLPLHTVKGKILNLLPAPRSDFLTPRAVLAAAAIFHIAITLSVFSMGRFGLYPQQIDSDGIARFASDSSGFRTNTALLANTLLQDGFSAWLANPLQIHIKLYSLSYVLLGRLLGSNILVAEPVNLFAYITIVVTTFNLTKRIGGQSGAWLASTIVALWPTLLLHTTQFLRDPIFIAALLVLVLVLTDLITRDYTGPGNLILGMTGAAAGVVLWMSRPDMWLISLAIVFFALVLIAIRMWREKKLLLTNLAVMALLFASMGFLPHVAQNTEQRGGVSLGVSARGEGLPLWERVAARRLDFITEGISQSGSMIDPDVRFYNRADVVKYVPRAVEIGYFAPFPATRIHAGYQVGLMGRLLAGIETSLTYGIELLACIFVWRSRRRLDVWLLVLTIMTGITALGLVVVNAGTLYRMRYAFWVLLTILGSGGLLQILSGRPKAGGTQQPLSTISGCG